ncbi:MAG: lytic murein transglycosylase [Kiloniellales bacterium]
MRRTILAGLLALSWSAPAAADFPACIADLKRAAAQAGVGSEVVARALDQVEPDEKVLAASQLQPEFKIPIWDYLAFLVDEERIADGRAMLAEHDALLRRAEERFGVDRHVIVAVWGVETDYGREAGRNFLPRALATLACLGERRQEFWRGELIAALELVDRGDLDLAELYGSWAGAFGQTQFIPSTYRRLAIDFDGDGRRDLVNSIPDALGSTANYLKQAGWRTGEPWLIEVKMPAGYSGPSGRKDKAPLSAWAKRGVTRADGASLSGERQAGLLLPAGPEGPGFLVFRNFDAIYSYNAAESYALAISHLADRIAGYPAFRTPWPTDDPGLSRAERLELQHMLIARGHDIGEPDGRIGPLTRAAIKEAEAELGMPETGRAGRKIYRALKGE